MNKETKEILKIIKSGITEDNIKISNEFSSEKFIELVGKHNIFALAYYGLLNCNALKDENLYNQLKKVAIIGFYISEQQQHYINKISIQFHQNNIDHMFLKGSILKCLYPHPEIRRMGDIDILIKKEHYPKIIKIMNELGFAFCNESNHELVWKKGNILIEFHKILMPSYNKDLHAYFGNGWKRAILKGKNCYTFSDEDMFIYIFSHFAKHFRDAGIGIIHMCDLYILLKTHKYDFEYINTELKKLKLYEFWCNIKKTIDVWFLDSEDCKMTDFITDTILNSGSYGLKEKYDISGALKREKKYKNHFWKNICITIGRIFPRCKSMAQKYEILKKAPFLLPVFWVWRWFVIIFTKRNKFKSEFHSMYGISEKEIHDYQDFLNYVGLDYNF